MVQSLSPQETSHWCDSLAPCGVRGEMLGALQAAITSKQVDGHRFNDLLRSNLLHNLNVDGLNPRIATAIRRAWNKDFDGVRFIPHYTGPTAGCNAGGINRSSTTSPINTPPPYAQRIRSAEKRAEETAKRGLAGGGEASVHVVAPATDFFSGSLDSQVAPKAAAYTSYGPPQPAVKAIPPRRRSQANDEGGTSLGDLMAPKPPAPKTFAVPDAQNQEQRRPRRSPVATGWEGVSLGDAIASGKQAQDRYATAQHEAASAPSVAGRPGRRHAPATNGWEGISLDNALGPRQPPQGDVTVQSTESTGHTPSSCSPPNLESDGANRGPPFRRRPPSRSGWEGVSLGDALSSAKCEQSRFGACEQSMPESNSRPPVPGRRRTEVNNGWDGVGLGEALGQKQPVRHTYGQTEETNQPRRVEHQQGSASPLRRDDGWNGISLGDAMQRPSEHRTGHNVVETQPPFDASALVAPGNVHALQQEHVDPWAGVSLADAMGKRNAPTAAASNSKTVTSAAAAPIDWSKEPRKCRGRGGGATVQTSSCDKSSAEIIEWLKSLPESHVPEKTREEISAIVEQSNLRGDGFTAYVQTVPPEVCAPKHAMKLKNAWANVLREAEARAIAKQNFDAAAQGPQKGIEVKC
mmetsp:Transcript_52647/g.104532  ORF Transcript_52647/g.104532 Transcript_52647/m.104532 type:complete len:635 (-) Transcript_52647:138-2042(-)